MSEQKRVAKEPDQLVAERTRELAEANEALRQELVVERQRTEAARRASDQDSRVIVASMLFFRRHEKELEARAEADSLQSPGR